MLRSRSGRWMATIASTSQILVLASCGEPQATVSAPPFEAVFELEEVIELGEDPTNSMAEIGVFVEARTGFIIGDRLLPRVRTYAADGGLEAGFGRFGDGPWEFRRIDGVALTSGRIVVVNWLNPGLTYLTSELARDTIVPVNGYVVFDVLSFGILCGSVGECSLPRDGRRERALASQVDGGVYGAIGRVPCSTSHTGAASPDGTRGVTSAGDSGCSS